jgi:hypothetical protein
MALPDPFEELVKEALAEEMGPPPSRELWKQIAYRIAEPPRYRSWRSLLPLLRTPLFHSALMVALLAWVVIQPAYRWLQQDRPAYDYYLEGDLVPPSAQQRPRPVTISAEDVLGSADGLAEGSLPARAEPSSRNREITTLMVAPPPRQAPDGEVKVLQPPPVEGPGPPAVAVLSTVLPRPPQGAAQ